MNAAEYQDFDLGYAVTIHKAQGVTVDQSFVLATAGFDRHLAYVSGSRHRESLAVFYSQEQFRTPAELQRTLSRERAKDVTTDYIDTLAETRDLRRPEKDWKQRFDELLSIERARNSAPQPPTKPTMSR